MSRSQARPEGESTPGELRLLVVDDEEVDRIHYRHLFSKEAPAWTVVEAATGEEGLACLETEDFDCVLLDYYLPDITGDVFVDTLAGSGDFSVPEVPVVVVTGSEDHALGRDVLERGAQDYIIKNTVTGPGMVRVVENAVDRLGIVLDLERERTIAGLQARQLEETRRQLEHKVMELASANAAKAQFLAVMSHEMRTPLNAILGYAELLQEGVAAELDPGALMFVKRIRVGGRHLLSLVEDILDFSRAEAGDLSLVRDPVDVTLIAREVVQSSLREAERKGLALELAPVADEIPRVLADATRVRQVLGHLVENAVKFTRDGGVDVRIGLQGDAVAIEVRDTGIGIEKDTIPNIFDRFFQVDASLTREQPGAGLGLAIARRLAVLMGGDIKCRSELGEGSTFTLLLPSVASGRVTEFAAPGGGEPEEEEPRVVLVVDDDPGSRHLVRHILNEGGITIREASDGESALASMRSRRPDAVVLDLLMPVVDGFGVMAAMNSDEELSEIPVIVYSAKSLTGAERNFLDRFAFRVLQKGEDPIERLVELIRGSAIGANGDHGKDEGSGGRAREDAGRGSDRPLSSPPAG